MSSKTKAMRFILLVGAAILAAARSGWALDPSLRISQYGHMAWRLQDGMFDSAPLSIAQTADGYLWIGTHGSLFRFDGVRFVPFSPPPDSRLRSNPRIESLLGASDGALWIGASNGLYRLKDGSLQPIESGTPGQIEGIKEAADGHIWVVRARTDGIGGPLCQVIDLALKCYGKSDGIPMRNAEILAFDKSGDAWLAGPAQVTRWRRNGPSGTYLLPGMQADEGLIGISALLPGADGSMLVGVLLSGGGGLQLLDHGLWKPYVLPGFKGATTPVSGLFLDNQSALWVGTPDRGIYRIVDNNTDQFGAADGLSSNIVSEVYQDHEGNLWVITSNGIDRFRDLPVASISQHEGLSADAVGALLATHDGTLWLSNGSALDAIRPDRFSLIDKVRAPGKQLTSLLEDHRGRLWIGADDQLVVFAGGKFVPVKKRDGRPTGAVVAVTEDSEENVWASVIPDNMLYRIKNDEIQESIPESKVPPRFSLARDPRGGIWLGLTSGRIGHYYRDRLDIIQFEQPFAATGIHYVIAGAGGAVWGGSSRGLVAWRDGISRTLAVKNGLPCTRVNSLLFDQQNDLWLYMACGLVRLTEADLREMWSQPDVILKPKVFDAFDGVYTGFAVFQPSAARTSDGRLWFANDSVVQVIDPAHIPSNTLPPPVHIEQVLVDRKRYAFRSYMTLPALTRELEIDYTALSLAIPERVVFRYKLVGYDQTWVEPGTRRQAFYSELAPGKYYFNVIAANNDGVWNETGASLNFTIAAAWYQMKSFKAGCLLLGISLVWLIYRLRVRQVAAALTARFDERMAERTRLAQELHDTLLQTIMASKRMADDELEESSDAAGLRATIRRLSQWLGQATQEGRAALSSLRLSLTLRNDLAAAFQAAAVDCQVRQTMEVSCDVAGEPRAMHPIARDEVYRIGYEAIRNACLHSGGTRLSIQLTYADNLTLRIGDNGVGLDPLIAELGREGHFGLNGMRERAARIGGKLSITSTSAAGTQVELWVPGKKIFRREKPRSYLKRIRNWLLGRFSKTP